MKTTLIFILFIALTSCKTNYQFTKGQLLPPDYVHPDTLLVVENFNIPDSLCTDEDIWNVLDEYTVIYYKE